MAARRKARKAAFDLLYEADQRGIPLSHALREFDARQAGKVQSLSEIDYARSIIVGVDSAGKEIDAEISAVLTNWTIERLFPVDRAILRIAVWEMRNTDTPADVVRSEALSLAAHYGSDDAVSFIGGVLGALSTST